MERRICAYNTAILPTHAYAIMDRLLREKVSTEFCVWRCHPLQALSIAMLDNRWVNLIPQPGPMDMVKQSSFRLMFARFPVNEDSAMPKDRIYFERDAVILAEIFDLAVPCIPGFEDEFKK